MITVYSKSHCPHCVATKNYLTQNGIVFETVDVQQNPEALAFIKGRGHQTVPQIYVGDKLLVEGGNSGLQRLTPVQIRERAEVLKG